jgi:YD repeat-containing protein
MSEQTALPEYTYDANGNELTYKDSKGYSYERTYDADGKVLTYKEKS